MRQVAVIRIRSSYDLMTDQDNKRNKCHIKSNAVRRKKTKKQRTLMSQVWTGIDQEMTLVNWSVKVPQQHRHREEFTDCLFKV